MSYIRKVSTHFAVLMAILTITLSSSPLLAKSDKPTHGISLYGDLKYPADFKHFDYVNPEAPKGGTYINHSTGTFDSLNPFIIKGDPAAGFQSLYPGFFYVTLTQKAADEAFSEYGFLAEKIELAEDRTSITYTLRENATFHDGSPIRPEDVIFSFTTAKEKGNPQFKGYYGDVIKIEKVGPNKVKFTFVDDTNKELALILGQMPIFSETYYKDKDFEKPSLDIPLGNGPYKIANIEPGRSIEYERIKDWWGKDIPVMKGRYNPDRIKFIYFRDVEVSFEGFKSGAYHTRLEMSAKNWAKRYDFPAFERGDVKRESHDRSLYNGMMMLAFNIRQDQFKDPKVRQAIAMMFDFNWTNKNVYYSTYKKQPMSYFAGEELAARGLPSAAELKILEPYRGQIPDEVFTTEYRIPQTKGDGNIRPIIKQSKALLREAGYTVEAGKLVDSKGKPLEFDIMVIDPASQKPLQGFVKNLQEIGVTANIKLVESAQYIRKINSFDYDMVGDMSLQSFSPGNEQREMWGSKAADQPGSKNQIGIKDKVVDEIIEKLIDAQSREDLINHTKALDRVLQWGHYVVPMLHHDFTRFAYWKFVKRPKILPQYDLDFHSWWIDEKLQLAMNGGEGTSLAEADTTDSRSTFLSPGNLGLYTLFLVVFGFAWYRSRRKKMNGNRS